MYKHLIVGLTLIILWGSGYYIVNSGGGELIKNALFSNSQTGMSAPTEETVAGIYSCYAKTGCASKYTILLKEDQTAMLVASADAINVHEGDVDLEMLASLENEVGIEVASTSDNAAPTDSLTSQSDTTASTTDSSVTDVATSTEEFVSPDVKFQTLVTSSPDANLEKGSWSFGSGNIIIAVFTEYGTTTYKTPHKLIIKKVEASILSRISFNKENYKDMLKPVFLREE